MFALYHDFIYQPLLNALIFLYAFIPGQDLGIAIIILTIAIRILLFPVFHKGVRYQMIAQKLQPAIKKIQEQHRNDRQKQTEAILAAYKEYNLNPFSGFLFFLVQLPILIALYHLFLNIFSPDIMNDVYGFIQPIGTLNETAFGLLNLKERSILVVVLAAAAQYWQTRLMFKSQPIGGDANISDAQKISQRIAFLGPILTVVIFFNFPSAMSLYWLTSSLFSVGQQYYVNYQLAHGKLGITDKKTD